MEVGQQDKGENRPTACACQCQSSEFEQKYLVWLEINIPRSHKVSGNSSGGGRPPPELLARDALQTIRQLPLLLVFSPKLDDKTLILKTPPTLVGELGEMKLELG